jgi:RimJ/RimL family protein N-acetyltransferase
MVELQTPRLTLRPWKSSDAPQLYRYARDERIGPRAGWPAHQSEEESLAIIESVFKPDPYTFAITLDDQTNEVIGSISLKVTLAQLAEFVQPGEAEVGYWIGVPFWGQGYAVEALRAVVDYAFDTLALEALWCGYYAGNEQSKRVQEKVGFVQNRVLYEVDVPLLHEKRTEYYTKLTREAWLTTQKN